MFFFFFFFSVMHASLNYQVDSQRFCGVGGKGIGNVGLEKVS